MPNWVYTNLTIAGTPENLAKFAEKASQPYEITAQWGRTDGPLLFWNFVKSDDLEWCAQNWRDFSDTNWGTKWDACDGEIDTMELKDGVLTYSFCTAWSIPEPAFIAIVKQHPELSFDFYCEEEQGWGSQLTGRAGVLTTTDDWDIPESHADYVERDKEADCMCKSEPNDQEYWFDDCPREEEPQDETADKLKQAIIAKSGVSEEWASKHLIVSVVK